MTSFAKIVFLTFTGIVFMMSWTNITLNNALKTKAEIDRKINKQTLDHIKELEIVRNKYFRAYKRYPNSIDDLINVGMLRSNFKTSIYSKDIFIDPTTKKISLTTDQDRIQRNISLSAKSHILQVESNKDLLTSDNEVKRDLNIKAFLDKKSNLSSTETTVSNKTTFDDITNNLDLTTEENGTDLYNDLTADEIKLLNQTIGY